VHDNLAVVQRLVELGADINLGMQPDGHTPLIIAADMNNVAMVRCLVELGAEVGAADTDGNTALFVSALNGHYLLEDAGAIMDDVNTYEVTIYDLLVEHFDAVPRGDEAEADLPALIGLLRFLVLHDAPLPALVALLSSEPARVVQEGARLRAQLPAFLVERRALLDAHCPVLLAPHRDLVHGYMELTTTEELWATGLGTAP
jgi:hypothetical protein